MTPRLPRSSVSGPRRLRRVSSQEGILLEIEDRAVDQPGLVGKEVDGRPGDILGREEPAGGRVGFRQPGGPVVGEPFLFLQRKLVRRQRPADAQQVDADALGPVGVGQVAGQGQEPPA